MSNYLDIKSKLNIFGVIFLAFTVISCGGGNGTNLTSGGGTSTTIADQDVTSDDQSSQDPVNYADAVSGAIEFISASPQNLSIKGMSSPGLESKSTVVFQVTNIDGIPISNAEVSFGLTTDVGGIKLSTSEGVTDSEGLVSTILQSGNVHTNVKVRASVNINGVSFDTESSEIIISTGVADQNSFSLSLSVHNPLSWEHDGETVDVNVYAADRYNNPVPDGTNVAFFTELGQIEPSCITENGACSVKWTSSNPRDIGILDNRYPRNEITGVSDGISIITAMVIGEESFVDNNSNGYFDDGDSFDVFSDKGEMFEDYNRNYDVNLDGKNDNSYDEGLEPFIDYNGNGIRDPKDQKYTGLGCQHSTLCADGNGLKHIYTSTELVMAEENLLINSDAGTSSNPLKNGITYSVEIFGVRNSQVPPSGTEVTVISDDAGIVFGSADIGSLNIHNNNLTSPFGAYTMQMRFKDKDPEKQENGSVEIRIQTANGQVVSYFLRYEDDPAIPAVE